MKILVLHQPFPMGNYKLNEIVSKHFSDTGHNVYLLQQLNGAVPDEDYINQIKGLDVDVIYFEMLDVETFKIIENLKCEKVLVYASKGILPKFDDIINYHGKWFTKIMTNSIKLFNMLKTKNIPAEFFKYYFSVLGENDLTFVENYNHDCVFLGMGFHRLQSESYKSDRGIFFNGFADIDFKIYGNGWPNLYYCGGVLPPDDIGKLYHSSKSGFALIGEDQRNNGQINNRYSEMAFSEIPLMTQNYPTIDWFGAENYINFVSSKDDAYNMILDILKNKDKYSEKAVSFKQFIINMHNEFFQKLDKLVED